MRLLIMLAAIAIPSASTPAQAPPAEEARVRPFGAKPLVAAPDCRRTDLHHAESSIKGRFNRLGELPPGQLELTVLREVDGCPDPLVVRQGFGLGRGRDSETPQAMPKARRW